MSTTGPANTQAAAADPAVVARLALSAALFGAGVTALVVGFADGTMGLVAAGVVCWAVNGGLLAALALRRKSRGLSPLPVSDRTPTYALARVESRKAGASDTGDIPVRFDLTVAPDDAAAYRLVFHQTINLLDATDLKNGATVVVRYPSDQPWAARLVVDPPAPWADRAAAETVESAPEDTRVAIPTPPLTTWLPPLTALAAGVALVLALAP